MTNPDRPFTFTVKGGRYWYFRSPETGVIRLPGKPEDPEFHRRYAELLENRVPLIVGKFQIVPTGSVHFKKTEKSFVYAEIYEPAMAVPDQKEKDVPAVGVHMEMLDATTGQVKKDFGFVRLPVPPITGNPTVPLGLIVSAPDLAAGAYKLRLTAVDATGHEFARMADFQLEN